MYPLETRKRLGRVVRCDEVLEDRRCEAGWKMLIIREYI
jgi:hypothetical protein